MTERKTKTDWVRFLRDIAERYTDATRVTLVMDNLNTHRPGALYETFEPAEAKALWDRFEFVYTPKHGSWLNVAEVEINVMIRQCLNRRIDSIDVLRTEVAAWQAARDRIKARSTGNSPSTTRVSSSSASIRRLMGDMTLVTLGLRLGRELYRAYLTSTPRDTVRAIARRVEEPSSTWFSASTICYPRYGLRGRPHSLNRIRYARIPSFLVDIGTPCEASADPSGGLECLALEAHGVHPATVSSAAAAVTCQRLRQG